MVGEMILPKFHGNRALILSSNQALLLTGPASSVRYRGSVSWYSIAVQYRSSVSWHSIAVCRLPAARADARRVDRFPNGINR